MKIRQKLQINASVSIFAAVAICLMLFMAMHKVNQAMEAAAIADKIIISIFQRSALREDYLQTNSDRAKTQWIARHEQIGVFLKSAEKVFTGTEDKKIVAELLKNHESIGKLFLGIVESRDRARLSTGSPALSQEVENRLLTQLVVRLYEKNLLASKLQERGTELVLSALKMTSWGIVGVLAAIIAAAVISSWSLSRVITERVNRLLNGATAIGGGILDHQIEIKGDDEFAEISNAFNTMTGKLRDSYLVLEKEIEERKLVEEELKKSEERLALAASATHIGMFEWDFTKGTVLWTRAHEAIFGYVSAPPITTSVAGTVTEYDYRKWADRVHPEDLKFVEENAERCIRDRKALEVQYRVIWPDGTLHWVETKGLLLDDDDGPPGKVFGVVMDITARKQAEEELRMTLDRLVLAQQSFGAGIWDWDLQTDKLEWSPELFRLFGRDPAVDKASFESWRSIVHPEDLQLASERIDAAIRDRKRLASEYRMLLPDGNIRWISVFGDVIYDSNGQAQRMLGICFDISEHKRVENELTEARNELESRVIHRTAELALTISSLQKEVAQRESAELRLKRLNRLYAVLCETNQAIVRAVDRDSLFLEFCRIAVEQGGFLLSWIGLIDKQSREVRLVAANGNTAYLDDIQITATDEPSGEGPTGIAVRKGTFYICNDFQHAECTLPWHERGKAHGIHASAAIAIKENGEVIGALTLYADKKDFFDKQQEVLLQQMGADISFALENFAREMRRQEAEIALHEATLERLRVVESLREKEQMLLQQSRLAAMGEMINNIAHQWRQPLNVLGLLLQQLQLFHEMGTFNKQLLDENVSKSLDLINHMSHTIDDFRNFFKPDKEMVEFAIKDVAEKTISLVADGFKSLQIAIDFNVAANPVIIGFPNEFSQVLLNILMNARDALLESNTKDATVSISLQQQGEKSVVVITDNAGGIKEEILGKIFDPYFTTKGPDKGTGVGLFMSKAIIEKSMNGILSARNTHQGAEFKIEL